MPRRAVLGQYSPSERLGVLASARLRSWSERWRSHAEELEVFNHALSQGWSTRRDGHETVLEFGNVTSGPRLVWLRRGTSDFAVFRQCLVDRHYHGLVQLARNCLPDSCPHSMLDGGANIGMSALYLASSFPGARLWCVEPDPANRSLCERNLAANGLAGIPVLSEAIWSGERELSLHEGFRDGRSWSVAVRVPQDGVSGGAVRGVGMGELIQRTGRDALDILKLDIEGAEEELFSSVPEVDGWLPRVSVMAIEVHTVRALHLITAAFDRHGFAFVRDGELLLAARCAHPQSVVAALQVAARNEPDAQA